MQIRDDYETITKFHGFSVETLLDKCWLAQLDLSESQEEKLKKLRERSRISVRRRDIGFLMRCARELEIIEEYSPSAGRPLKRPSPRRLPLFARVLVAVLFLVVVLELVPQPEFVARQLLNVLVVD